MKLLATFTVYRMDDGTIQTYDRYQIHAPESIAKPIEEWFNKHKKEPKKN